MRYIKTPALEGRKGVYVMLCHVMMWLQAMIVKGTNKWTGT